MQNSASSYQTTRTIRDRVARGGERLWRIEDFEGQSYPAVAQALSRLSKNGVLARVSKGVYYKPRKTSFGDSRPNPADLTQLAAQDAPLFPAGRVAANLLGFSTQVPRRRELATTAASLPRKLVGKDTVVHTLRPAAWAHLSETEAALLDFLRGRGRTSELSPADTLSRTLDLLAAEKCYESLARTAETEPPRVRALLGALGELLGKDDRLVDRLRVSLNPLSRFDFGVFSDMQNAGAWQAKERKM